MKWQSMGGLTLRGVHRGKMLAIILSDTPKGWLAIAIEGPAGADNVDAVFDNHAHKAIGMFATPMQAMRASNAYVKLWKKRPVEETPEACECGEIEEAAQWESSH